MLGQILWTACVTPLNDTGDKVDYQSLERLLQLQESAGNGILLFGSTGEGLSLTDKEKKEILNFALNLKLTTQIIAGVPSHNLYAALEWLEFCNNLPIQGYMMTTPIYTKPGITGQTKWFEQLLDRAAHPTIIYNNPGRAAINFHAETAKNLQSHKRFVAIKDSSGTIASITEYSAIAPDMPIYCGDDYMMPEMAAKGAIGLISIASNAWPKTTRRYTADNLSGNRNEDLVKAGQDLFTASNPIPIKALLKDIGIICHNTVRSPLSTDDLPSRETLLRHHETLNSSEERQ